MGRLSDKGAFFDLSLCMGQPVERRQTKKLNIFGHPSTEVGDHGSLDVKIFWARAGLRSEGWKVEG